MGFAVAAAVIAVTVVVFTRAPTQAEVPPGGAPPAGSGPVDFREYVRVIDGDTAEIFLEGLQVGVGLIGIDAPQGNTTCGMQAAEHLARLVDGGFALDEDPNFTFDDRYRRMYYAYTHDGRSIAREMVRSGHARADGRGNESATLARDEAEAKSSARGCLWRGK